MQLYALNLEGQVIHAQQASRQTNYYCLECQQVIRLRGGPYRQRHFYHLEPTPSCRQHQKGPVHLQLQSYLLQQLSPSDCRLELRFPSIQRIADVAWMSRKIVFEIQCSAIKAEEVLQRNQDYQRVGWDVIWILNDQRYNQVRLSAAEIALRFSTHFFCRINPLGQILIYDQFDVCQDGIRKKRLPPLPIRFHPNLIASFHSFSWPLMLLQQRTKHWKYFFEGDLIHLFLNHSLSPYLQQAIEIEKKIYGLASAWSSLLMKGWQQGIVIPYQIFFRFLLERVCR